MSRPARARKPGAALRFLEASEAEWEKRQKELDATAAIRRKARKEREREKARAEKAAEKEKERARKAKEKAKKAARASAAKAKAKAKGKKKNGSKNGGVKRPTSAYFYFVAENRDDVKAENPTADFGQVSRILGNEWRSLTDDERAHFEALAAKDKKRYEREMAAGGSRPAPKAPKPKAAPKPKKKKVEFKPPSSYFEYCAEAIGALRDRTGSSYSAIEKYIAANHPEVDFKRHHFRAALKRGVEAGSFIKVKASFKLDQSMKKRWQRKK